MRQLRNNDGFTLIELMIVVVIIGILAAIAIPRFTAVSDQAKQAEAAPILRQICSLAQADHMRNGDWHDGALGALSGWAEPDAKYFSFAWSGSVATANPIEENSGVTPVSLDCDPEAEASDD